MIAIKVFIPAQNKSTAMRFNQDCSVMEVCKQIREKFAEGGADHGIFRPAVPGRNPAQWLRMEKTLQFYDLQSNDEVHYKKKHRPVKVRLLDDTVKTIMLDDSLVVMELVNQIGEKLGIKNAEEFSLQAEGVWLNPTLSLNENGVQDETVIWLKKKFFFNDSNVDRSDPAQLHLLYVQCRDNINSGSHPVSKEEATQLAALECQVQYGNHDPTKHKAKWLDLTKLMAPSWVKKIREEDIYREHKKLVGMSELNAKYRYVQLCRALKTFGITSYEVKERKKGTKKVITFYLGITRDSIMRMNAETKEVEKTWPLTHLRRWAASDKTFTLDFGDYEEDYLAMQTPQGEEISQLLGGYIDIILKRKKDTGRVEVEDDSTMAKEEFVAPIRAAAVTTMTSSIGAGGPDGNQAREGILAPGQQVPGAMGMGGPNALGGRGMQGMAGKQGIGGGGVPITDLPSALEACNLLIQDLATPGTAIISPGDIPPEEWRKQMLAHANALGKNALDLFTNANKAVPDRNGLDAAGKQIGLNIQALVDAARHAAVNAEDDISLLSSAKAVSEAVADILKCAKDLAENPNNEGARAALKHATEALKAAQIFLASAHHGLITDQDSQDLVLESAKAVAAAAAESINTTYEAARGIQDPKAKQQLTSAGKGTAAATNSLVSIAKSIAPGLSAQQVRQHFIEMVRGLGEQNGQLNSIFKGLVTDPSFLDRMAAAGKDLNEAIAQLIAASETLAYNEPNPREFTPAANAIASHVAQLSNNGGNPQVIRVNAQGVSEQTGRLIQASKLFMARLDSDVQKRMMNAAAALTDAAARLALSSKDAARDPKNETHQRNLTNVAKRVAEHTNEILAEGGKAAAMMALRHTARRAAADTTALCATAKGSLNAIGPQDQAVKNNLKKATADCMESLGKLINGVKTSSLNPNDPSTQSNFLEQAKKTASQGLTTISVARRGALKVVDPAVKKELVKAAEAASQAVHELLEAAKLAEEIGQNPEVSRAIDVLQALEAEVDSDMATADIGMLQNHPGQTRENALALLQVAAKNNDRSLDELQARAVSDPDTIGPVATAHTNATDALISAARDVASTTPDKYNQRKILQAAKQVAYLSTEGVKAASKLAQNPGQQNYVDALRDETKKGHSAISDLVGAALGLNTAELAEITDQVGAEAARLMPGAAPPGAYSDYVEQLQSAAKALNAAVSSVVSSARINPKGLGVSSKMTAATVPPFVDAANFTASAAKDKKAQLAIISEAKAATNETANLLQVAKDVASTGDGNNPELANTAQAINEAITRLLNAAAPGRRELLEAQDVLAAAVARMNDPSLGGSGNLEDLNKATKRLAESLQQTAANARNAPEKLGENVKTAAAAVATIIDAQKAIISGGEGVNPELLQPCNAILQEAKVLKTATSENQKPQTVLAAKSIAQSATKLSAATKQMAQDGSLPTDVRNGLLRAAANLALATANLGRTTKGFAKGGATSDEVLMATRQVEDATKRVLTAAPAGKASQSVPREVAAQLQNATRAVADSTTILINSAGVVLAKSDAQSQAQLSQATTGMSEAVAVLTNTAASLAPGVKECDRALELLNQAVADIDGTLLNVAVGNPPVNTAPGKTHQDHCEDMIAIGRDAAAALAKVVQARNNPAELASAAEQIGIVIPKLTTMVKNAVATTSDQKRQIELLKVAKDLAASMLSLVGSAKLAAANPSDTKRLQDVIVASQGASQSISKMVGLLKNEVVVFRDLDDALAVVRQSTAELDTPLPAGDVRNYGQCRQELTKLSRELALAVPNLTNAAKANLEGVPPAAKSVGALVRRLVGTTKLGAACVADVPDRTKLLNATRDVNKAVESVLDSSKALCVDQKNAANVSKTNTNSQNVSTALTHLLNVVKEVAKGERDNEAARNEIHAAVNDLDAAALFAAANQLEVELPANASYDKSERDLDSACTQVKTAAAGVASASATSSDATGTQAKALAAAVAALTKASKETAMQIPDMVAQQDLLTSAKGVAISAQSLVAAAQTASENPDARDKQADVATNLEKVQSAVDRLRQTSQQAAAEAAKGVKELDNALAIIADALKRFDGPAPAKNTQPTNEDVITGARAISTANAHLITAANAGQEELAAVARETAEAAVMMLDNTKAAVNKLADKPPVKAKLTATGKAAIQSTAKLLDAAKVASRSQKPEAQTAVSSLSQEVMERINDYVAAARELPGAGKLKLEEDFGEDLDEMAEKELRNAAMIIEKAAASLLNSRGRSEGPNVEINFDDMDITDAILEAARAIALATGTLVKAAANAQRDRVQAGRDPKTKHLYKKDPTWANGLISAAQTVAGTTQHLVLTANKAAKKEDGGDEDHLVATAKSVAAATAQLVAASKAKADPQSATQKMLSDAAKSVAKATSELVNAAKAVTEREEEEQRRAAAMSQLEGLNKAKIDEIEQQATILKLERELQKAREKLLASRKGAYANVDKAAYSKN